MVREKETGSSTEEEYQLQMEKYTSSSSTGEEERKLINKTKAEERKAWNPWLEEYKPWMDYESDDDHKENCDCNVDYRGELCERWCPNCGKR